MFWIYIYSPHGREGNPEKYTNFNADMFCFYFASIIMIPLATSNVQVKLKIFKLKNANEEKLRKRNIKRKINIIFRRFHASVFKHGITSLLSTKGKASSWRSAKSVWPRGAFFPAPPPLNWALHPPPSSAYLPGLFVHSSL